MPVVEEEEEPDFGIPRIEITPEIIAKGLSEIRRTAGKYLQTNFGLDGTSYAFTRLTLEKLSLQELGGVLESYANIQSISFNNNEIRDIASVQTLPYLLNLQASNNVIQSVQFFSEASHSLQFLQVSILQVNRCTIRLWTSPTTR